MLRRALLALLSLLLLAEQPGATWSIVCVDRRTREVGVASATCLENFNLRTGVPVVYVGEGAAAAQSFIDSTGENRQLIFESFRDTERTPAEILALLAARDGGHQTRQYGIVNFAGPPVSFTGRRDGLAATGVTGSVGDVWYSIQGNVLTGNEVVLAAEAAFRAKKGDLGQRMMAAMEAARALGGDGRCSCSESRPTSCGVPPPGFVKSAHVGVVVVARVGDTNGGCDAARGCAQGQYYLNLNVRGDGEDPDPVFTLQNQYASWRHRLGGRPDGIRSRLGGVKAMPADGATVRTIVVELRDLDDRPLTHGGAELEVTPLAGAPPLATVGPVLDLGNGRYTFTLRAGTEAGLDRLQIRAVDAVPGAGLVTATLYPPLEIQTFATPLAVGVPALSASGGGRLPFVVERVDHAGSPYLIVARLLSPRQGRVQRLPELLHLAASPFYPGAPLALDATGHAEFALEVPPRALEAMIGRSLEFTGLMLDGPPLERTNAVEVDVVP